MVQLVHYLDLPVDFLFQIFLLYQVLVYYFDGHLLLHYLVDGQLNLPIGPYPQRFPNVVVVEFEYPLVVALVL